MRDNLELGIRNYRSASLPVGVFPATMTGLLRSSGDKLATLVDYRSGGSSRKMEICR
jgi:hypothetical protein